MPIFNAVDKVNDNRCYFDTEISEMAASKHVPGLQFWL